MSERDYASLYSIQYEHYQITIFTHKATADHNFQEMCPYMYIHKTKLGNDAKNGA